MRVGYLTAALKLWAQVSMRLWSSRGPGLKSSVDLTGHGGSFSKKVHSRDSWTRTQLSAGSWQKASAHLSSRGPSVGFLITQQLPFPRMKNPKQNVSKEESTVASWPPLQIHISTHFCFKLSTKSRPHSGGRESKRIVTESCGRILNPL